MPFTTPILAGARLRRAARGLELIVPHPAGARGVYIMACSELPHFCALTLHDLKLSARLGGLPQVTPRSVRGAVLTVAASGAAGRGARAAAEAALTTDRGDHRAVIGSLLNQLVRQQTGVPCPAAELDRQVKAALLRLAPVLRRPAATLTLDIEALAGWLAPVVPCGNGPPRCERLADHVGWLANEMRALPPAAPGRAAHAARLVVSAADATLAMARRMLTDASAHLNDVAALLAAWANDPARTADMIVRAEWMLDGWVQACLVWRETGPAARSGALAELALLVPVIPREAADLTGHALDEASRQHMRALVLSGADWRTGGLIYDLVARNERILEHAA